MHRIWELEVRRELVSRTGPELKDKKNMISRSFAGAALGLALSTTAAFAQSYTAPAGIPAVTAPGGLEGRAAAANLADYYGQPARPGRGKVSVEGIYTGAVDTRSRHERRR